LLKTPDLAVKMVRDVRRAVSIPLSVKFRTGWEDRPEFAMELARRFEGAGADALIFHPRVAPDRRTRPPKWSYIRKVKESVSIPVFGNGEVFTADDCENMIETTGCDGVSLGRIAVAKPWVFSLWQNGGMEKIETYKDNMRRMAVLFNKHFEPVPAIRKFKKMAIYNASVFRFGHSFFKKISHAGDFSEIEAAVADFFSQSPALAVRPNLNMFR